MNCPVSLSWLCFLSLVANINVSLKDLSLLPMQHPTTPQDADWRAVYALRSLPRALYHTPFITTNTVGSALADLVPACCTPRQPSMHLQRMVLIPSKFGMMPHLTFGGVAVDYTLKHEPLGGHLEVQALNSAALLLTFNEGGRAESRWGGTCCLKPP